ncbi:MAG TPA: OmpH family outer membrane protein [Sphingomicrobium sp.]|nr:OmpH family outer membrane protein [Sphingomicrobium sp.]
MTAATMAQTAAPAVPSAPQPAAAAAAAPQAIPAKIALIEFEQAVFLTNEGQQAVKEVQAKYAPKKTEIESLSKEVDTLKKQLQSAPATMTDEERSTKVKAIDAKEKDLNREAEDAQTAYNADLQQAFGKVAQKVSVVAKKYAADNGFTMLMNVSSQTSDIMWIGPNIDVTKAVADAYNASSPAVAATPSAPAAHTPAHTAAHSTTTRK